MFECLSGRSPAVCFDTVSRSGANATPTLTKSVSEADTDVEAAPIQLPKVTPVTATAGSSNSDPDPNHLLQSAQDKHFSHIMAADTRPKIFDRISALSQLLELAPTKTKSAARFVATEPKSTELRNEFFSAAMLSGNVQNVIVSLLQRKKGNRPTAAALLQVPFVRDVSPASQSRLANLVKTALQVSQVECVDSQCMLVWCAVTL